jgi:hypothetical protein
MVFGGFLKGSAPWTRRQNTWFGVYCVTAVAITCAVVGIDRWADASISRHVSEGGAVAIRVDAAVLRCSREYFFGHDVLLDRPDGVRVWRRVCRDWIGQHWFSFPVGEEPPDRHFDARP